VANGTAALVDIDIAENVRYDCRESMGSVDCSQLYLDTSNP
jgi:hypothetical protein